MAELTSEISRKWYGLSERKILAGAAKEKLEFVMVMVNRVLYSK
ncbi:MAG: hypothetical protein PWQ17_1375 [Anaerophaga sp.]|nr:hypothetical protein [Anaerophaga sp.]